MESKDCKIPLNVLTYKTKERMKVPDAPFVSLVPIPSLALDYVDVNFQMDIDDSEALPKHGDEDKGGSSE